MGLRELWGKLIGRSTKPELTPVASQPTPEEIVAERQEELLEADEKQREADKDRHTTP